ncbi:hypothetical protein FQA39_LY02655 [Lamprigera yunnana]|nr:hypothetical protein FQA39_LY02655 [Lamprigera yunnana]
MGANFSISSIPRTTFEILNEFCIAAGSGITGLIILINHGMKTKEFVRTVFTITITLGCLIFFFQTTESERATADKVVFITGCDSGLGFSFAQHLCELGFTVLAGCLSLDSEGSQRLRALFGDKIKHIELDITRPTSVAVALNLVIQVFKDNPNYKLWALINNAGVMVFGEFEWLTEKLIQHQLEVNLSGTFRLTRAFCPLLRAHKARLINISSHCALETLPGLSIYGATKAALKGWNDALRVELKKYDVNVILFIPGSFIHQSNIMASQIENCFEMYNAFTTEQIQFYGDYFNRYNNYLNVLAGPRVVEKIENNILYTKLEQAVLETPPSSIYIHESLYYSMYHTLFKYSPIKFRDYLMTKFMQMPSYDIKEFDFYCTETKQKFAVPMTFSSEKCFLLKYSLFLFVTECHATNVSIVEPRVNEMDELVCYQCKGDSRKAYSPCDTSFFRLTNSEEKYDLLHQCDYERRFFCVKLVYTFSEYTSTERGCTKSVDDAETAAVLCGPESEPTTSSTLTPAEKSNLKRKRIIVQELGCYQVKDLSSRKQKLYKLNRIQRGTICKLKNVLIHNRNICKTVESTTTTKLILNFESHVSSSGVRFIKAQFDNINKKYPRWTLDNKVFAFGSLLVTNPELQHIFTLFKEYDDSKLRLKYVHKNLMLYVAEIYDTVVFYLNNFGHIKRILNKLKIVIKEKFNFDWFKCDQHAYDTKTIRLILRKYLEDIKWLHQDHNRAQKTNRKWQNV